MTVHDQPAAAKCAHVMSDGTRCDREPFAWTHTTSSEVGHPFTPVPSDTDTCTCTHGHGAHAEGVLHCLVAGCGCKRFAADETIPNGTSRGEWKVWDKCPYLRIRHGYGRTEFQDGNGIEYSLSDSQTDGDLGGGYTVHQLIEDAPNRQSWGGRNVAAWEQPAADETAREGACECGNRESASVHSPAGTDWHYFRPAAKPLYCPLETQFWHQQSYERRRAQPAEPLCSKCGGRLQAVTNQNGYLNDEQFDSVRAGDYVCKSCKGDRAKSGHRYYWKQELPAQPAKQEITTTERHAQIAAMSEIISEQQALIVSLKFGEPAEPEGAEGACCRGWACFWAAVPCEKCLAHRLTQPAEPRREDGCPTSDHMHILSEVDGKIQPWSAADRDATIETLRAEIAEKDALIGRIREIADSGLPDRFICEAIDDALAAEGGDE